MCGTPRSRTPGSRTPRSSTLGSRTPASSTPRSSTLGSRTPGSRTPGSSRSGRELLYRALTPKVEFNKYPPRFYFKNSTARKAYKRMKEMAEIGGGPTPPRKPYSLICCELGTVRKKTLQSPDKMSPSSDKQDPTRRLPKESCLCATAPRPSVQAVPFALQLLKKIGFSIEGVRQEDVNQLNTLSRSQNFIFFILVASSLKGMVSDFSSIQSLVSKEMKFNYLGTYSFEVLQKLSKVLSASLPLQQSPFLFQRSRQDMIKQVYEHCITALASKFLAREFNDDIHRAHLIKDLFVFCEDKNWDLFCSVVNAIDISEHVKLSSVRKVKTPVGPPRTEPRRGPKGNSILTSPSLGAGSPFSFENRPFREAFGQGDLFLRSPSSRF